MINWRMWGKLLLWLPYLLPEPFPPPSKIMNVELGEFSVTILHLWNKCATLSMSFTAAEDAILLIITIFVVVQINQKYVCKKWTLIWLYHYYHSVFLELWNTAPMSKKLPTCPCSFLSQGLKRDFGLSCLDLGTGVILCWMAKMIILHGKYIIGHVMGWQRVRIGMGGCVCKCFLFLFA